MPSEYCDPVITVRLRESSWENIFRVLLWCAPLDCSDKMREGYFKQYHEHFSLGGFWAQIQEAQRQVDEAEEYRNRPGGDDEE